MLSNHLISLPNIKKSKKARFCSPLLSTPSTGNPLIDDPLAIPNADKRTED